MVKQMSEFAESVFTQTEGGAGRLGVDCPSAPSEAIAAQTTPTQKVLILYIAIILSSEFLVPDPRDVRPHLQCSKMHPISHRSRSRLNRV
jgi:hypothetical protein